MRIRKELVRICCKSYSENQFIIHGRLDQRICNQKNKQDWQTIHHQNSSLLLIKVRDFQLICAVNKKRGPGYKYDIQTRYDRTMLAYCTLSIKGITYAFSGNVL
jgi:hypothetical protein